MGGPSGSPATIRVTSSLLAKAVYLVVKKGCVETKLRVTFPLKKQRGRIIIPTVKGQKILADIVVGEAFINQGHSKAEMTEYIYLGYLTVFQAHLIQVQFYETTQWLLIDASGRQIELWGEPVFAPDMKHIAASCMGIKYGGGQPDIIQLLELKNGVLSTVWSSEPKTWGPYRICWSSSNSLLLSKKMWTEKNPGNTSTHSKLTIN